MSDVEIEQKREEDERLDTAEDLNEEVRPDPFPMYADDYEELHTSVNVVRVALETSQRQRLTALCRKRSPQ